MNPSDADRAERTDPPRRIERVWEWFCASDGPCTRKTKPVTLPPVRLPDPCRDCGNESWRKADGEKLRAAK
jgi:hypothetical protein